MASVFTMIIAGDIPGHFVYRDDTCVAFLSIDPLSPGHTLVVPIAEVDHWIDLDADLATHLMLVAQRVAKAIDTVYQPKKVGLMIAGLEVPHVHLHVTQVNSVTDLDFANARRADDSDLAVTAAGLSAAMTR